MKRYEQQLEIISKLEEKQKTIENAKDDAFIAFNKDKSVQDKQELSNYMDKLKEQSKEIWLRLREHTKSIEFVEGGDRVAWYDNDGLYTNSRFINKDQSARFTLWLMMMNEEVQDVL
jgi:uncharacterized protein YhaN